MSEVQDACQIVIVTGKSAYWIGKITTQLTMMILKLMNTIYLAKWKGATTLNRFRNIKGDDFMFINASTEDRALLQHIEKEMEDHGILLARLPDLCGGDGRTQYVISPSDSAKFKAFLLDHNAGRYRDVKVGPISAEDYARSGTDRNGRETPEMQELSQSANEVIQEQKQIGVRQTAGYLTMQESTARAAWPLSTWRRRREPVRKPARNYTELPLTSPMVQYNLVRHDEQVAEQGNISWISKPPLKRHEKWAMYEMPDGIHTVIISNSDQYQVTTREGAAYRAAIYGERMYRVVNMKNGAMELSSGLEVAEAMSKPDIRMENERLKNLAHNRGVDIVSVRDDFSYTELQEVPYTVREDLKPGSAQDAPSMEASTTQNARSMEATTTRNARSMGATATQDTPSMGTASTQNLSSMGTGSVHDTSSHTVENGGENVTHEMSFSEGQYLTLGSMAGNEYQIPFRTKEGRECFAIIPEKDCRLEYDFALDGSGRMEWVLTARIQPDEKYGVFYYAADSANTMVIRDEMSGSELERGLVPQNLRQAELSGESKAMTTGIQVPSGERERLIEETSFLASDSESFAVYRFSDDIPEWSYKEHDLAYVEKLGLRVDGADYDMVYSGRLSEVKSVQDLYNKFSGQLKPSDFPGQSLTMSDVVVVNHDGKTTAWYIDHSGFSRNAFVEMPEFVEQRDSYIRERQLHPDAERHIAQTAKMFSKDRDDKAVLQKEEVSIIVIPQERVADMEELTGRKTFYIEFPAENSGTYVQFPKDECRFSEDGKSLIVELRDEESYHMFGYLPNTVGENREFGSRHISGAEIREELVGKTRVEVRETPAKEEPDRINSSEEIDNTSGRTVRAEARQTLDKRAPGADEKLSRRPGIDQEDGFLRVSTGLFGIYQPDGNGKYDFVYLGKTSEVGSLSLSNFKKLLQNGRAADFTGRPLSTNDIIVLTGPGNPRVQAFRINGNKLEPCQQFVKEREAGLPPLISNKEKLPAVKRTRPVKPRKSR